MTSAVFDCMIYLQAATNEKSPAFACLELAESNEVRLFISPPILAEIRDVLSRPKIRAKYPHLTPERVDLFLLKLATIANFVSDVPDSGIALRDPDDLPYLNLAIAAGADYLVSRDKDLLDLMKDEVFRGKFPKIRIVAPAMLLHAFRSAQFP